MKKFKIQSYAFDFIDGLLRTTGDIALSNKIPANDVANRITKTFLSKPKTPELEILFLISTDG